MKFLNFSNSKFYRFFSYLANCELGVSRSSKNGISYFRIRNIFLVLCLLIFFIFMCTITFGIIGSGIYISQKIQITNLYKNHIKNLSDLQLLSQNTYLLEEILQEIQKNIDILDQFPDQKSKKNRFGIGGREVSFLQKKTDRRKNPSTQNFIKQMSYFTHNKELQQINIDGIGNFSHIKSFNGLGKKSIGTQFSEDNSKLLSFLNKKRELFQVIPSGLPLKVYNTQCIYEILEKEDVKKGVFIRVPTTTEVLATSSGVVESIKINANNGKYSVVIFHKMGMRSEYHNLSSCKVLSENLVYVNQILGTAESEILYRVKLGSTYEPAIKYLSKNL